MQIRSSPFSLSLKCVEHTLHQQPRWLNHRDALFSYTYVRVRVRMSCTMENLFHYVMTEFDFLKSRARIVNTNTISVLLRRRTFICGCDYPHQGFWIAAYAPGDQQRRPSKVFEDNLLWLQHSLAGNKAKCIALTVCLHASNLHHRKLRSLLRSRLRYQAQGWPGFDRSLWSPQCESAELICDAGFGV